MSKQLRFCPRCFDDDVSPPYVVFRSEAGMFFNRQTSAYEAYVAANWGDYAHSMLAEAGGCYTLCTELQECCEYNYTIHEQETGVPLATDPILAQYTPTICCGPAPAPCCPSDTVAEPYCEAEHVQQPYRGDSILDKYRGCFSPFCEDECCE